MDEVLLYMQVAAAIRDQIKDGALKPSDPVPSIRTVCEQTGYSRQTVGKALRLLVKEGLISNVRGRGYYVE